MNSRLISFMRPAPFACLAIIFAAVSAAPGAAAQNRSAEVTPQAIAPAVVLDATTSKADVPTTQTESWLQIQTDGSAASFNPQYATPTERELSYQRLLDSYKHPIPEFFSQEIGGEITR